MARSERSRTSVKVRDWVAVAAHFRSSAGPMRHRCVERGGAKNDMSSMMLEYQLDPLDPYDDHSDGQTIDELDMWEVTSSV